MRPIDYWTYFWFVIMIVLIPLFIIFLFLNPFTIYEVIILIGLFIALELIIFFLDFIVGDFIFPTPYAQTWKEWFKYRYSRSYENFKKQVEAGAQDG